jgi:hypothetical protein
MVKTVRKSPNPDILSSNEHFLNSDAVLTRRRQKRGPGRSHSDRNIRRKNLKDEVNLGFLLTNFHEVNLSQKVFFCAVYCINNMLGATIATRQQFDEIGQEMHIRAAQTAKPSGYC